MKILIIGANSDIAFECIKIWEKKGHELFLAVRNETSLAQRMDVEQLKAQRVIQYDAAESSSLHSIISACAEPDVLLLAHGVLDPKSLEGIKQFTEVNFSSLAFLAEHYAHVMAQKGAGSILGIGSVAALRGRSSNYQYGASKAALHSFLSGLRNKYSHNGIHVCTIIPGPVKTKMLEGVDLKTGLIASPEKVAKDIDRALQKKSDIVYTPWYWKWIMMVIRLIPEFIFKKLKL